MMRAVHDPDAAKFYVGGGVCVKELLMLHAGDAVRQHSHTHDHLSLLAKGTVSVFAEGKETVYDAPAAVLIKANTGHLIEALSDDVLWYCLHAVPAELAGEPLTSDRIEPLLIQPS